MTDYPAQSPFQVEPALAGRLAAAKEAVWFRIGVLQSAMNDRERALDAFERVLAVNPANVRAMTQAGAVLAKKECYPQAVAYLQRAIAADSTCGEAWAVLAHCYVMTDDLQKAYEAYQSALSHLPNPRDPNLWYGIGLLYDRYGSLDNALEAFLAVLSISPDFERADEVCFCIGIIYKEQQNFNEALKFFNKVVVAANPPPPLTRADGWYQIGHVNELKRDIPVALDMYRHALAENPKHPKTLQNFGWLEHQHNQNSTEAIRLLKLSADLDPSDGQTWYLLGRVYMALREFRQAYDAYQQAVYRDGRNATFWCSIGVLYYQMNQYRDAMDAYSRAIRLNPYVSEVWYDLGTLYESCGQNADAIDAYRRAAELAPENTQITQRLSVLENSMNPAHQQQQQQQQQAGQPPHSAQQPQPPMPPQQLQPDMHHPSQQHLQSSQLNPVLNRPMAPPIQQLSQPLGQQKLSNHQSTSLPPSQLPPAQQGPLTTSATQQRANNQNPATISGPQRTGQMDVSPLASLRPQNLPHSQGIGHSGGFSQDGRPSLPAPLASAQPSAPLQSAGMNHLSPMVSQSLHSQPQSTVLPPAPLNASQPDSMQNFRPRSIGMPHSQLQPLGLHGVGQEPQRPGHPSQASHPDSQQHPAPHSQPGLGQLSSSQPMTQSQMQGQGQADVQQQQSHLQQPTSQGHTSPHAQAGQDSSHQQRQQHQQPASLGQGQHLTPGQPQQAQQQHSPHSQSQQNRPHTNSNGVPGMQPLPQLPSLPQMQQPQPPDSTKRSESQPTSEAQRHGGVREQENDRSGYVQSQADPLRRADFDRNVDSRLPKLAKPEGNDKSRGYATSADGPPGSQPLYASTASGMAGVSASANHIPSLREPGADASGSAPLPSRSMSMHELTQPEPRGQQRRSEDGNRDERDRGERGQSDVHPEKGQLSDRLPALSSISGQLNSTRESREDARLLTSMASPSLPLPSSGAGAVGAAEGQKTSSSPLTAQGGPSPPGIGTNGAPLPSISGRPTSSLSGIGQESKELPGMTSGMGVSSLTKFGKGLARTPATPVNNSVAPSSLPSPLAVRKGSSGGTGIVHAARSPRISKPSNPPNFKSTPIPPTTSSQMGQIESVPSPSSLPILPALSSHPSSNGNEKASAKDKGDQDPSREHADGEPKLLTSRGDDKNAKEGSSGRKSEEGIMNKPLFSSLRSAPAPVRIDMDRSAKDEKVKSPTTSAGRQEVETVSALKREAAPKDDPGRTAKRPRLHELNEHSEQKGFSAFGGDSNNGKKKIGTKNEAERKEDDVDKSGVLGPGKTEIPSYKAMKTTPGVSQPLEADKSGKRDSGVDADTAKNMPLGAQVIDLPRLSTPMSRSGPPSLPGNTPLPSFRSERMKSTSQDNTSRSSLPFPLRSAPVSSLPAPLKPHLSTGRAIDRDYSSSQPDESVGKRVSEDKVDSGVTANGPRDDAMSDRVANGDGQKGSGPREPESRSEPGLNSKDEKQSGRTEIHSSAT